MLHTSECKCFHFSPIIVGALLAIGLSFLLNLFSIAIGITAYTSQEGVESLAMGGLLATAIGIVASMFASGWVAGYLARNYCDKGHLGALYGFLTWVVALLVSVLFAHQIAQYIGFYGQFLAGAHGSLEALQPIHKASTSHSLIISTYILFVLFFLSAFAASIGGHCGMRFHCDKC